MTRSRMALQRFAKRMQRALHPCGCSFAIAAFGIAALAAACSPVPRSSEADPRLTQKHMSSYASGSCFYSDVSDANRLANGRVSHWCGPEPKGLN